MLKKEIAEMKAMCDQIPNSQELLTDQFLNQKKPIALNPNLLVNLIGSQILPVNSWQKRFAFALKQAVDSMNDPAVIDFVELFVIKGVLDKNIINKEDILDLYSCIELFSKTKNNNNAVRWKSILNLFEADSVTSDVHEDLANVYFEQWLNCRDWKMIAPMFCYKIGVVFKNSQHMSMFVKISLELALEECDKGVDEDSEIDYTPIEKFAMMIVSSSFNWTSIPGLQAMNVIDESQALNVIWEVMDECHTERLNEFDQTPFKRILVIFIKHVFDVFRDVENFGDLEKIKKKNDILMIFATLFKKMNPNKYPAFAFGWLELISSPYFMPLMFNSVSEYNTQEKWFKLQELFIELFNFLKENIYENSPTTPALEKFFEGTLKLCLVVLHDYPEFFCLYYFQFINNLPLYRTGNLRNMILAAYPRNLKMPDPLNPITKFETSSAIYGQDKDTLLKLYSGEDYGSLKSDLDKYLETEDTDFLKTACEKLEECQIVINNRRILNTGIVHAAILYLAQNVESKKTVEELEDPKLAKKYEAMCQFLSTPVRDILLSAMFNELRLLNKSTVFFMNVLLHIFRNCNQNDNVTVSQIARILIGRIRLPKIHPWGLVAFQARLRKEQKFQSMNVTTQQQA